MSLDQYFVLAAIILKLKNNDIYNTNTRKFYEIGPFTLKRDCC